jgi:hypothetical protein
MNFESLFYISNTEDDLTKSVTNGANAEVEQETSEISESVPNEGEEKFDRDEAQAQEEVVSNDDRASADESLKQGKDDEMAKLPKEEEISKDVKDHHENVSFDNIEEENGKTKENDDQDFASDNDNNLSNENENDKRESEKETDQAADVATDVTVEDDHTENKENNNIEEES